MLVHPKGFTRREVIRACRTYEDARRIAADYNQRRSNTMAMTNETIQAAAHTLSEALKDCTLAPVVPCRLDTDTRACDVMWLELLSHCLWLLNEIPNMLAAGKREKAMRWLCWCQGVAFARGWVSTISELKEANRGADAGA